MAIKTVESSPNIPRLEYIADTSQTYVKGGLLYRDTSNGVLKEVTSKTGNTLTIEAICAEDKSTDANTARIEAYPIGGPGQLFVADTNANTANNQLNKAHAMTSATIVNNTSSHVATSAGVFVALRSVGAASDKKLIGYFVKVGQVTA